MPSLNALKVSKAVYPQGRKGPALLSDGQGLNLQIMPTGSKSWILRFTLNGKSRTMGLGAYGDGSSGISLAKAREREEGESLSSNRRASGDDLGI